ncbi:MAG: hypothetical protein LBI43_02845 [Streptococcaceae bacterium]|jgi:hypothetical protein|nr:hypothetical protein [Streptococcaceae bacterium]
MLKVSIKMPNGLSFEDEFDSRQEFISVLMNDFPPYDDSWGVLEVAENGELLDFTGTVGDLYQFFTTT